MSAELLAPTREEVVALCDRWLCSRTYPDWFFAWAGATSGRYPSTLRRLHLEEPADGAVRGEAIRAAGRAWVAWDATADAIERSKIAERMADDLLALYAAVLLGSNER